MSIGEFSALIAALAFVGLVVFICLNLSKLAQVIQDVQETVKRINTTVDVVTKDVDNLSIEVEGLLNKANTLVDDVNGKLSKTDPLFVAIGDLGETVSDLNVSTKQMATNLVSNAGRKRSSPITKFLRRATKTSDSSTQSSPVTAESTNTHSQRPSSSHQRQGSIQGPITISGQGPKDATSYQRTVRPAPQAEDVPVISQSGQVVMQPNSQHFVSDLDYLSHGQPSTTAGEISLKTKEE